MIINKQRSNSGFTLIEMTISILVIGIVSGLSLMIFSEATENYFSGTSSKKLLDDTRATFLRLSQEIRDIDDNQQITSSTANKLYTNSTSSDKSVEIVADDLFINNNNSSNILSDQLDASGGNNFSYIDSDFNTISFSSSLSSDQAKDIVLVKFDLQLMKEQESISFRSHVYPRNLKYGRKMSYHE